MLPKNLKLIFSFLIIVTFIRCQNNKTNSYVGGELNSPSKLEELRNINETKIKELSVYYNLDNVCTSKCNKPILLMFTGYACVNAVKMTDDIILGNPEVYQKLKNDFINVWLYVDDKETGKRWYNFEKENFRKNTQPLFVILNSKKETISETLEYTKDYKLFMRFLDDGFENYYKN